MYASLARETSTTTGTGTLTTLGAVSGFRTLLVGYGTGNEACYTVRNNDAPTEWEVGIGVVTSGSLTRVTVLASSNAGSLVSFSAGTKDIIGTVPAEFLLADTLKVWGNSGTAAVTLDAGKYGSFTYTCTGAHTVNFGTWPTVGTKFIAVTVTNGAAYAITWPTVTWRTFGGTAPSLLASGVDTLVFWKSGSVVYGMMAGLNA